MWQQSFRGTYDTPFRNRLAKRVVRQRFVSMEEGRDPRALLRESQRESSLLTVECRGNYWPPRGALVTVEVPRLGTFESCPVRSARYVRDGRGGEDKTDIGRRNCLMWLTKLGRQAEGAKLRRGQVSAREQG